MRPSPAPSVHGDGEWHGPQVSEEGRGTSQGRSTGGGQSGMLDSSGPRPSRGARSELTTLAAHLGVGDIQGPQLREERNQQRSLRKSTQRGRGSSHGSRSPPCGAGTGHCATGVTVPAGPSCSQ